MNQMNYKEDKFINIYNYIDKMYKWKEILTSLLMVMITMLQRRRSGISLTLDTSE